MNLTSEQKTFIVQHLACYYTPQEVADLVNEQWGLDVSRQAVAKYNAAYPTDVAPRWQEMFHETRAKFHESTAGIAIANQSYRLQQWQKSLDRLLRQPRKNEVAIHNLLERAAKEAGGMFTNRRELTGAEGKPLVDTTEFAKSLLKELVEKDGLTIEQAVAFVSQDLKVDAAVLVSEAEN